MRALSNSCKWMRRPPRKTQTLLLPAMAFSRYTTPREK